MELSWNTQLSSDYLSNEGKLRLGSTGSYEMEQLYSLQGGEDQEVLFKIMLASPLSGHEYKVYFAQKVMMMKNS